MGLFQQNLTFATGQDSVISAVWIQDLFPRTPGKRVSRSGITRVCPRFYFTSRPVYVRVCMSFSLDCVCVRAPAPWVYARGERPSGRESVFTHERERERERENQCCREKCRNIARVCVCVCVCP